MLRLRLFVGCEQKVEVPQKFREWNSSDGAFALQHTALWIPEAGLNKNHGISHAKFEKAGISIPVDASMQEGLIGSIGVIGYDRDMMETADDMRPEAVLHQQNLDDYQENYRDYEELPAETIRCPIGSTRIAEFTATDGFSKIHGIRATVVTSEKGVTFRAYAPEDQWEEWKPVFFKMLESMKRGTKSL